MNRREFLRNSVIASGAVATGVTVSKISSPIEVSAAGLGVKKYKTIDDVIKFSSNYKRFDQKNTAFNLSMWSRPNPFTGPLIKKAQENGEDPSKYFFIKYPTSQDSNDEKVQKILPGGFPRVLSFGMFMTDEERKKPGYQQLDWAMNAGGKATEQLTGSIFSRAFSAESGPEIDIPLPNGQVISMPMSLMKTTFPSGFEKADNKWSFKSANDATYAIKKAAKVYGADLVGIAPYDERFVYNTEVHTPFDPFTGTLKENKFDLERKVDIGFKPKSVIVLAHEMDYELLKASPSPLSGTSANVQYAAMVEVSLKLATMIRKLGYNAKHSGNDTALSIPYAILAGLGEGSRMGMVITEKYGPRVRISKVFTDMELVYDQPKTFGVREFCEVCMKCADVCPSGAISKAKSPTSEDNIVPNRSVNGGVEKWYNDGQKCLTFWIENHIGCINCVSACPYNKIDEWHHDISKIATKIPGLNSMARYLDEFFGYGEVDSVENMENYWKKSI